VEARSEVARVIYARIADDFKAPVILNIALHPKSFVFRAENGVIGDDFCIILGTSFGLYGQAAS
jgi:hypothetical protein